MLIGIVLGVTLGLAIIQAGPCGYDIGLQRPFDHSTASIEEPDVSKAVREFWEEKRR